MPENHVRAYLDNSATTKPCEQAIAAMTESMRTGYFNPSSPYAQAVQAEHALKQAREIIAAPVDAAEKNVIFTSGGTESDNLAIFGCLRTKRGVGTILYSAAEHPAVANTCRETAAQLGGQALAIPLDSRGSLDLAKLETMLTPEVRLICVMQVCNETGVVMPLPQVAALRDRLAPEAAIHVDGVQGYLRVPFSFRNAGAQSYAVSAHKVHGPKGVGALMLQDGYKLHPILEGGGQQGNLRSGTENTAGIEGFAAAVAHFPPMEETGATLAALKQTMAEKLTQLIPGCRLLGPLPSEADSAPHILYVAFPPVRAETMVHALEAVGVLAGTGSACSSHKKGHSGVLAAMGLPPALMESAVRFSFSLMNTPEEICYAADQTVKQYGLLARFTRR